VSDTEDCWACSVYETGRETNAIATEALHYRPVVTVVEQLFSDPCYDGGRSRPRLVPPRYAGNRGLGLSLLFTLLPMLVTGLPTLLENS
jgi:hypothetical protein